MRKRLDDDKWISVSVVVSQDEYEKLSLIARINGWTMQGLLGPMLREKTKELLVNNVDLEDLDV